MAAPAIRIRVGAALDSNISNAFKPIVQAAREARQAIEDEMARAWAAIRGEGSAVGPGAGMGGPYRAVVKEAERAADKIVETEKKKQRKIEQEEKRAQRRRESAERYVAKIKDRHFAAEQRREERDGRTEKRERVGRSKAIIGGAGKNIVGVGKGALGIAGSVARGAGVQTDLGAYVGKAVELETRASELSAAAYDEKRDKGKRLDPKELVTLGRQVGQEAAFDPSQVLEGLQAFVGKTGDLQTGKAALPGLAKLARATGTSLEDMVGAAGESAKALGEVGPGKDFETAEAKGKALVNVLRLIAGQGKVGAVELKDLAKYGGRLAAASQAFGGDASKNLGDMGALAQLAVSRGGAASAAEAATSVAGFANTLKTPARAKEFAAHGVDIEDKEKGGFRSVRDILKDASAKAVEKAGDKGSSTLEFKKMFANIMGARAADPAMQAYSKAFRENLAVTKSKTKADEAGRAAVDEMFDAFGKAISANEEKDSFDRSMQTGAAKVQLFNNRLGEIGARVAEKILPELERFAPTIVKLAESMAKLVSVAVDNPGAAIALAITGSIAKAAIGNAVSGAVTKMIEGAATKMGGVGLASAAITIAAATLIISKIAEEKEKGAAGAAEQRASIAPTTKGIEGEFSPTQGRFMLAGGSKVDPESLATLESQRATVQSQIAEGQKYFENVASNERYAGVGGKLNELYDVATTPMTFEDMGRGKSAMEAQPELLEMRAKLDAMIAELKAQGSKTQKVEVTNLPTPGTPGPVANTANTTK
jgi:hypothetical protein